MSRIHLSRADVTEVEERLVVEALRSGWVAPLGPMVERFEREICERTGVAGALALASGTAALHLALLAEGAGPGTVVVLPSMTFAASANAVLYTGAEPVFVDSGSDANVDVDLLLAAVDTLQSEGRTVACVLSVDLFGRCVDYTRLSVGLDERRVALVEDAAEALGASHHGRPAGSFGHSAALSFNGNKIMTTSGGGMLLSDDLELLDHARYLSTQARQPFPWYEHTEMGFNYRMSNILAALGVGQLSRLDEMMARRRRHRERYRAAFSDLHGVRLLSDDAAADTGQGSDIEENCWLTCIVVHPDVARADSVVSALSDREIEARHLWKPMHLQPLYADARTFTNGTSEQLFAGGVTLPSGSELDDSAIDRVITAVTEVLAGKADAA